MKMKGTAKKNEMNTEGKRRKEEAGGEGREEGKKGKISMNQDEGNGKKELVTSESSEGERQYPIYAAKELPGGDATKEKRPKPSRVPQGWAGCDERRGTRLFNARHERTSQNAIIERCVA